MEVNERDFQTIENMKEIMWKFPSTSKEYKSAQSTLAFVCERLRRNQKSFIGSLEEKIIHESEIENQRIESI